MLFLTSCYIDVQLNHATIYYVIIKLELQQPVITKLAMRRGEQVGNNLLGFCINIYIS